MNNNKQYTITLTERQLRLLAYACRVTDRLIIGQLDFSLQECCEEAFEKLHKNDKAGEIGSDEWNFMRYKVTEAIQMLRKLCWGVEYGENYGIRYDNTADILYDMQKVMEHALWLEEDPEKRSKWTNYYTLLFRADGRGSKVLTDKFGDSLGRMTAVTDRHSAYFALHFLNHQVCLAHLLRELQYLSELNTGQDWSKKVTYLFREAIHERNTNPSDIIDKVSWTRRLDNLLKQNIDRLGQKFITFKKGLVKCRDYIFSFLENPMIPSDNNGSERGIRKLKSKLKNSCTFRSDFGADAFLELHSVVETAKKHNKTPYHAIQALFEA